MVSSKIAAYKKAKALQMADFMLSMAGLTGCSLFYYEGMNVKYCDCKLMPNMKHVSKRQLGEFKHNYAKGRCSVFSYYSELDL